MKSEKALQTPENKEIEISQQAVAKFGPQPVAQIPPTFVQVPWGHHMVIISKCKELNEALYYINQTARHSWSRNVLLHQMDVDLYQRQGKAVTNFEATLPAPQADLARELLKDPYVFDFLALGPEHQERDLEHALTEHITKFLLELGQGFAYVGRQYPLHVEDEDYRMDLLFYHLRLRCYVVLELKAGKFIPEYAGKLNFYLNVVDDMLRHPQDEPTIGILICKERNRVIAEYALKGMMRPMGVTEYELAQALPENLKGSLPTIEEIEAALNPE